MVNLNSHHVVSDYWKMVLETRSKYSQGVSAVILIKVVPVRVYRIVIDHT